MESSLKFANKVASFQLCKITLKSVKFQVSNKS